MKFTINYHGDKIVVYWLNLLKNLFGRSDLSNFFSATYGQYFNHFSEYWQMVGAKSALLEVIQRSKPLVVQGFHLEEAIFKFVRSEYPNRYVAVFLDIAPEKVVRLLETLPGSNIKTFMSDVVCIVCKSREEIIKITKSVPENFASVFALQDGVVINSNVSLYMEAK